MSKLNKTKEYAIKYLLSQSMSSEDIAKELNISVELVNTYKTEEKTKPAKTDKTKDLMIRQTAAKKNNSVSIMTEPASQLGDTFLQNMAPPTKKTDSYIFRPKQN
jgi:orotate phosphoribosyltransferase-like protein